MNIQDESQEPTPTTTKILERGSVNSSNKSRFNTEQFKHNYPKFATSLTVLQTYHYNNHGNEFPPVSINTPFVKEITNAEQAYLRNSQVSEEWIPLDTGWLGKNVSMIVIQNERTKFAVNPNEDEKKEAASKVIEIGLGFLVEVEGSQHKEKVDKENKGRDMFSPPLSMNQSNPSTISSPQNKPKVLKVIPLQYLLPGESLPLNPIDTELFYIRCKQGKTKVILSVFPK